MHFFEASHDFEQDFEQDFESVLASPFELHDDFAAVLEQQADFA